MNSQYSRVVISQLQGWGARRHIRALSTPALLPGAQCLATAGTAGRKGMPPTGTPAVRQAPFHPSHTPVTPFLGREDSSSRGGWWRRSWEAQGARWLAHLPLVPMQQGRPLIWQSTCRKPVWLLLGCSVQICGRGTDRRMGLCGNRGPFPALPRPLPVLDTHRPLGDVIRPDVSAAGGWLLTGSGGRGQRG